MTLNSTFEARDLAHDRAEIARALRLMVEPGDVVELRAPQVGSMGTIAGYFDDMGALAAAAASMPRAAAGVYVTLNPVNPTLLARAANRALRNAKATAGNTDVVRRTHLLVDCDAKRPTGISSTDAEHAAAHVKAQTIREILGIFGFPDPIYADSGNGAHLVYRVALPNDAESTRLVEQFLAGLDQQYSDDTIKVDTAVGNAARISKLYGTVARKGENVPERPHRLSRILEAPDALEVLQPEQLAAIKPSVNPLAQADSLLSLPSRGTFDVEAWMARHNIEHREPVPDRGGRKWVLNVCPFNPEHKRGEVIVGQMESGAIYFKCAHESCAPFKWPEFREKFDGPREQRRTVVDGDEAESALDVELSRRLAKKMAGQFVYERGGRQWMHYVSGRYVPCARGEEFEAAKALGPDIARSAPVDADKFKAAMQLAMRMQTAAGIKAALMLAQSDPRVAVSPDQFDADPDLLNVLNGVVHLPTQALMAHDPSQLLSHQCPVPYHPEARADTFERFLRTISKDDPEWVDFLQRAVGYTLSGRVGEEVIFFMLGIGSNGKSVFCNVVRRVLGAYSIGLPANFLMASNKADGEAATPALARLPGVRMAQFNEIEAGAKLSAQTVKLVTATDAVSARRLYGEFFDYAPSHTPWVRANHRPIVTDNDEGIWRRIVLIPFDRHFTADEKDVRLEEKIMAEAPGVLAWMVRGHAAYLNSGMRRAKRVAGASASYRRESDLVGQWMDERSVRKPGAEWVKTSAFSDYRHWCSEQGLHAMTMTSFTRALNERGISDTQRTVDRMRTRVYVGIAVAGDDLFPS